MVVAIPCEGTAPAPRGARQDAERAPLPEGDPGTSGERRGQSHGSPARNP